MNRRALLLTVFSLVVIAIGAGLYFLFFAPLGEEAPIPSIETPVAVNAPALPSVTAPSLPGIDIPADQIPPDLPEAILQIPEIQIQPQQLVLSPTARGGLTAVNTIDTTGLQGIGFAGTPIGDVFRRYNPGQGIFEEIDAQGNSTPITEANFPGADEVVFAPQANKVILEFPDGANVLHNFDTDETITLPAHWEDFAFEQSGDRVVYKSVGIDNDNNWLAIMNSDGSGIQVIEPMGINADRVIVDPSPSGQVVAFSRTGQALGFDREEIFLIGKNGENFRSLIVNGRGFIPLWSPTGEKLIYSVYSTRNDYKPELWVATAQGNEVGNDKTYLNVQTFADKCVFADTERLICAVPTQLPERAGMFRELAQDVPDLINEINLSNNTRRLIAIPEVDMTVRTIQLSEDGQSLFIIDENDSTHIINL